MNITIHRGANQIGGCITEISTENCRIFIDFGGNLPGCQNLELSEEQIGDITGNADAIFYTHYHGDHVGLHHLIPARVKQYIGKGAVEVIKCKYEALKRHGDFSKQIESAERMQTYEAGKRIDVENKGEIIITPYFVSHSAFDAYMFKIECEGKKILHTGDFRRSGYLGKGLFKTLEKYVGEVDVLITEGTMLGRRQEHVLPEHVIQRNIINVLKKHKYVFALCSSTDIDRLASLNAACRNTGRVFFVDSYQRTVLDVFTKYAGAKSGIFKFNPYSCRDYKNEKTRKYFVQKGFLVPIRMSGYDLVKGMMDVYDDEEPWLIYSMWGGYAEKNKEYTIDNVINIRNLFGDRILDGTKDGVHTSGHADAETLEKVCRKVNPRIGVIPIHKDKNSRYESLENISEYKIFHEGHCIIGNISITIQ